MYLIVENSLAHGSPHWLSVTYDIGIAFFLVLLTTSTEFNEGLRRLNFEGNEMNEKKVQ